jgi:prephenate dehydrogenase
VTVAVPNRPGVVAELALKLGGAGINISDLSLTPALDGTRGEVTLWVASADAERAGELIAQLGFAVS